MAAGERAIEVRRCSCGGSVRWENLQDSRGERWLGVCQGCRMMVCVPLDDPRVETKDPLTVFFCGQAEAAFPRPRPPWLRFIRLTAQPPWNVRWDLEASLCEACPRSVSASREAVLNWRHSGSYKICLGCGSVRVRYTDNQHGLVLAELIGSEWTPPGPPVLRLRADVFALHRFMDDQFRLQG